MDTLEFVSQLVEVALRVELVRLPDGNDLEHLVEKLLLCLAVSVGISEHRKEGDEDLVNLWWRQSCMEIIEVLSCW